MKRREKQEGATDLTIRIGIVEEVSAAGAKVIVTVQEKSKEVSTG